MANYIASANGASLGSYLFATSLLISLPGGLHLLVSIGQISIVNPANVIVFVWNKNTCYTEFS